MTFHSQRECLQSAEREKAVERSGNRAHGVLQKCDLIAELLVFPDHNDAANHIGVPVQIFRGGMNDHVEAELDRALHPGAGESVVGNADGFVGARDLRDRFEVDQFQQRIAWRFDPDHPRIRSHRRFDLRRVRHVDEGEIQIGRAAANSFEEPERAAVKIVADEDV